MRYHTTDDGIGDEEGKKRFPRHESADGWSDDPGHIADDPQNAKTLLAFVFRQDIRDHGAVGWSGNIREQPDANGKRNKDGKFLDKAERERAERAENQTADDQFAPAEFVCQRAADHLPDQPGDGEQTEHNAGFGHANAKFLGDVKGKEREEHGPANVVDEGNPNYNPESLREFLVYLTRIE